MATSSSFLHIFVAHGLHVVDLTDLLADRIQLRASVPRSDQLLSGSETKSSGNMSSSTARVVIETFLMLSLPGPDHLDNCFSIVVSANILTHPSPLHHTSFPPSRTN